MSMAREFQNALKSELGSAGNQYLAINIGGAKAVLINLGPCEVYDWTVSGAVASAVMAHLLDASATGEGSVIRWSHRFTPLAITPYSFRRPLIFEKGLVLSFTATGSVSSWQSCINWSPLGGNIKKAGSSVAEFA